MTTRTASIIGLITIGLVALSGCSSPQPSGLDAALGGSAVATQASFAAAPPAEEYTIAPQDRLSVSVYPDKTLTVADVRVDANGSILVPPLGVVRVEGLTTAQASSTISSGLAKCCLRSPQVAVQVLETVGQQFTVAGAVKSPNAFTLKGHVTLLQAVSMAGGADTSTADLNRVALIRTNKGQRIGAIFNLREIMAGRGSNPEVRAGDEIIVDSSSSKTAWKSVLQALPLATLFAVF